MQFASARTEPHVTARLAGGGPRWTTAMLLILAALPAQAGTPDVARGEYLASIMDCAGCHAPRGADGAPIAGAGLSGGTIGFEVPGLGVFWPPNLTPHESGLAGWSTAEIVDAIRAGIRPDGRILAPAMPWENYSHLTDEDAAALATYLRSREPVDHQVPQPIGPDEDAPAPAFRLVEPDD